MPEEFKQQIHLVVIQAIYEAVHNSGGWNDIISDIRKVVDGTGAFFMGLDSRSDQTASIVANCVDKSALNSTEFVQMIHGITAGLGHGSTITLDMKRAGSVREAQFAQAFRCDGHLILAVIAKEGHRRFVLGLVLGDEDKADILEAQELLLAIVPHLQIAVSLSRLMIKERERAEHLDRLFSQSVAPRAVISHELRIIENNPAFDRLLENDGTVLGTSEGHLEIGSAPLREEIERLLASAARSMGSTNVSWVKDPGMPSGWLLKVDPVAVRSLSGIPFAHLYVRNELKFMLSLYKVGDYNGLTPALISSVLGLTTAEAALACELAHGEAPSEIAHARGVAKNTVHNQLSSIMSRHGFHRQGQLLTLLSTLAFFLG